MTLPISLAGKAPVVQQIEGQIKDLIRGGLLRQGVRMPSVRQLAADLGCSKFTVVTAYDRLVAMDFLVSRRASGFFVGSKKLHHEPDAAPAAMAPIDADWLMRSLIHADPAVTRAGSGVLPTSWMATDEVQKGARTALRHFNESFAQYPAALGWRPLRDLLALKLIDMGVSAQPDQVVLTAGATQALDLAIRTLLKPGDTILVEEPGYYTLFAYLRAQGIHFAPVPRTPAGLDIEALEQAVQRHSPKALYINSMLHNPTGGCLEAINAHRILGVADRCDMVIIEDDTYGDFYEGRAVRLANLDQLNRVVYVSGFSKSVSASLRVGYLVANPARARQFAAQKLVMCLATSELNERVVAEVIASGAFRRRMDRLRVRLATLRPRVAAQLRSIGFETPVPPQGGFFLWARSSDERDTRALAHRALAHGVLIAPGSVFMAQGGEDSPWVRFNAAHCDNVAFLQRMKAALADG